jgi:hypothetical protein
MTFWPVRVVKALWRDCATTEGNYLQRGEWAAVGEIGVYRYLCVIDASHETPKIKNAVHHVRILLNDARESL